MRIAPNPGYLFRLFLLWVIPFAAGGQSLPIGNYHLYEGASKGLIKGLSVDNIGYVWIITDEGVFRYDGRQSVFFKDGLDGGFAKSIRRRRDGKLLVVHDLGLTEIESRIDTTLFRKLVSGDLVQSGNRLFFPKEVYEDRRGTIWIGEDNTISRYSESGLRKYHVRDLSALRNIFRNFSLAEDDGGTLWAVSYGGDVLSYDPARDTFLRRDPGCRLRNVSCLLRGGPGRLLAGTGEGIFELRVSAGGEITGCRQLPGPRNISTGLVIGQEVFWGTWNQGLYRAPVLAGDAEVNKVSFLPFDEIVGLYYDPRNGLWAVSGENIASLNPGFFHEVPLSSAGVPVDALTLQSDGALLAAAGFTIDRLAPDDTAWRVEPLDVPVAQTKTSLLATPAGLWIGSITGEVWFHEFDRRRTRRVSGIAPNNKVTHLLADQQGNVWAMGNQQQGVIRIDSTFRPHFYNGRGLSLVQTACASRNGNLLFFGGTHPGHYLYYYLSREDSLVDISLPLPFEVKRNFSVNQLLMTEKGELLLATSHGLLKYYFPPSSDEKGRISRLDLGVISPDEPVLALAGAQGGGLWVSTTNGLISYDGRNALLYDRSSGLPGNSLSQRGLCFDRYDNLWVAASRGVAVFRRHAPEYTATPAPVITGLEVNGRKRAWPAEGEVSIPFGVNVELTFFAPAFPAEDVVYQTRLLGADSGAWSAPFYDRGVLLPNLPVGDHTFLVRAQRRGGFRWSEPATLTVTVLRPWHQTWWAALLFTGLFFGLVALATRIYAWRLVQHKRRLEAIVRERTREIVQQDQQIIEQKNQIIAQQERYQKLQEKQLQDKIEHKNKQLTTYTLHLIQKNEALRELQAALYHQMRQAGGRNRTEFRHLLSLIDFSFRNDEEWDRFKLYFEGVHAGFFENLVKNHADLTPQELRLCALIRLNLSIQEIADVLGISPQSVKTSRLRLRKKLEQASPAEMVDYLMTI